MCPAFCIQLRVRAHIQSISETSQEEASTNVRRARTVGPGAGTPRGPLCCACGPLQRRHTHVRVEVHTCTRQASGAAVPGKAGGAHRWRARASALPQTASRTAGHSACTSWPVQRLIACDPLGPRQSRGPGYELPEPVGGQSLGAYFCLSWHLLSQLSDDI